MLPPTVAQAYSTGSWQFLGASMETPIRGALGVLLVSAAGREWFQRSSDIT